MGDIQKLHMNGNERTGGSSKEYKLIYFDVRGRGEVPRLLFHAADVPFTDKRVTKEDNWFQVLKHSKLS